MEQNAPAWSLLDLLVDMTAVAPTALGAFNFSWFFAHPNTSGASPKTRYFKFFPP